MNKLHKAKKGRGKGKKIQLTKLKHGVYGPFVEYKKKHDIKLGGFMSNHNLTTETFHICRFLITMNGLSYRRNNFSLVLITQVL